MAQARRQNAWQHTASLMALIANVNRDPKKTRPFKTSDFDPFAAKTPHGITIDKETISILRNAFTGGNDPHENGCSQHNG